MKKGWILLLTLLPLLGQAQNTEGKILFEEKMNMHIDLKLEGENAEMMEQLKAMMPEFRTTKKMLTFMEGASIYSNFDDGEGPEDMTHEGDGVQIQMRFEEPEDILYKNLEERSMVRQQEFFTRKFLIKDKSEEMKWKLTGESKEVLGYMCQQAISGDSADKVIAWFSPEIPISGGPSSYGQLPGMILEVEANEGKLVITASSITLEKVDKKEIIEPKKGKVVTREEFEKLQKEKMKEMEMEMGGSGGTRIIIQN